jgi:hypothetical protein
MAPKSAEQPNPAQFAQELAEFVRNNPEKLDQHWANLLVKSKDPNMQLVVASMEAALAITASEAAPGVLTAFEPDSVMAW